MTDTNKQALRLYEIAKRAICDSGFYVPETELELLKEIERLKVALQPPSEKRKPSVDVDLLHLEKIIYTVMEENQKAVKNGFIQQTNAMAIAKFLHSQGHLNQGWRDIESAPKDGTAVLMTGIIPVTNQKWVNQGWWDEDENGFYDWGECESDYHGNGKQSPTHWMPLPTPPSEGE
jgi:hypothetical protein